MTTATTTAANIKLIDCPKCSGHGHIGAFAHVANGVCFCCQGARKIRVDIDAQIAKVDPTRRRQAEWVLQSTPADYENLSFGKLLKIRDFCHGGWGLAEAFPTLYQHWFENGEAAFQAAQEARLAAFYASR